MSQFSCQSLHYSPGDSTHWSVWSACSNACAGQGNQARYRHCSKDELTCSDGKVYQTKACIAACDTDRRSGAAIDIQEWIRKDPELAKELGSEFFHNTCLVNTDELFLVLQGSLTQTPPFPNENSSREFKVEPFILLTLLFWLTL